MAVPSSGQLRLRADIALEVDGSATGDNVSLGTLSNEVGFTEPDTMSEFYGYVSYIQPTMTGTPSTSSVSDTSMIVTSPTFSNPSGGTITLGFYFGTSTTMTNNTFYAHTTYTGTGGFSFARQFSGLSSSTTYRAWAVLRDTESPARFTEVVSSMKSQATLPTVSYSITNASGSRHEHSTGGGSPSISNNMNCTYQHVYYGWTTTMNYTWTTNTAWASRSINLGQKAGWQTGQGTQNRGNYSVTASGEISYPGMHIETRSPYSSGPYYNSNSCSNNLGNSSISITGSGNVYGSMTPTQCSGLWECYTSNANSSFSGSGYTSRTC